MTTINFPTDFTTKTTPVNADLLMIADSADSNRLKKITYNNLKGATGDAGASVVWRGVYNPLTPYSVLDSVSYNGSAYICKLATTGNLPSNTTYWDVTTTISSATTTSLGGGELATSAESIAGTNTGTGGPLWVSPSDIAANSQSGVHTYAADAGANDTYVISLTPNLTAYTVGMRATFKANTANTGACTLNIDSLGAIPIKTSQGEDPDNGLIEANEIITATYNGTNFIIPKINPLFPIYDTVKFTRDTSIASGTQVINHGLGVVPSFISFFLSNGTNYSDGDYDGTDSTCVWGGAAPGSGESATYSIRSATSATDYATAVVTATSSTTFTLTRTKNNSASGTVYIKASLQAFA